MGEGRLWERLRIYSGKLFIAIKLRMLTLDLGLRITLDLPIIKGNYLTSLKASGYDGDLRFVFALIGF